MKRYITTVILLIFTFIAFAQEKKVDVVIKGFFIYHDSLSFYIEIENVSNQVITIYKPETEDICRNILKIRFIDLDNSVVSVLFPCRYIIDLDRIILDCHNSVYLNHNERFGKKFNFSATKISPFLVKGKSYKISVELNLKEVNFETDLKNIYKDDIKSDELEFLY